MTQQTNENSTIYEANGQDYFNYVARYGTSNVQIQGVLVFKERIDLILLEKAVRLSIEVEPILGCRFVENDKKAYWEKFEDRDKIAWYTYLQSEDQDESIKSFLAAPLELEGQQQVEVKLIDSSKGSTICIKVNHACSDAKGVKDYLSLLSEIYTGLSNDMDYRPLPLEGRRDAKNYFDALGIDEPMALFNPQENANQPTWVFPYDGLELSKMHVDVVEFLPAHFKEIRAFARENKATINTMLLTAFYRSLFDIIEPQQGEKMEIYVTTDLRKILPKDQRQSICNLSSMMNPQIARMIGESFEETLVRVKDAIETLKNEDAGLSAAVTMEALGRIDYAQCRQIFKDLRQQAIESKKASPMLSNVGIIPILKFGNVEADDAYIVTPSMHAPGFMLGASTYKDRFKLVVSYYEPSTKKEDVRRLLDTIREELQVILK